MVQDIMVGALILMRLVLFGMALGLTVISFQAYSQMKTQRLQYAFVGFAFISMGIALTNLNTQIGSTPDTVAIASLQIAETIPFIIGFGMIYVSLYR